MSESDAVSSAFVTGATGFVGAAVARELLKDGVTIRVLARPGSDPRNLESLEEFAREIPGAAVERVEGDLRDRESLRRGLEGCDALYHVAARYSLWNPRPAEIYRDNVDGTRNILEAARDAGVGTIVYTSTVGTIHIPPGGGSGDESRLTDIETLRGHYKRSKWFAEQEARRLAAEGLPVVIVHPSAPVGRFDVKPTPTGQMVVDFLDGKAKAYTDTGLNVVDVEDVARGHLLAARRGRPGDNYILGSENMSLLEIFQTLGELCGLKAPRVRIPMPALAVISVFSEFGARVTRRPPLVPWEAVAMSRKRMYFTTTKAREALGYEPSGPKRALARAALWFYENGFTKRSAPTEILARLREAAEANGASEPGVSAR